MTRANLLFPLFLVLIASCTNSDKPKIILNPPISLPEYRVFRLDSLVITLGDHMDDVFKSIGTVNSWKRNKTTEEYLFPHGLSNDVDFTRLRSFKRERNGNFEEVDRLYFLDSLLIAYDYSYKGLDKGNILKLINSKFNFYEDKDIFFIAKNIETLKTFKQEYDHKDYFVQIIYASSESTQGFIEIYVSVEYKEEMLRSKLFK